MLKNDMKSLTYARPLSGPRPLERESGVFLLALWAAGGVPPWRLGRETRLVMLAALGFLALRHRSFWLGVAAHWFIGFFMDVLASWRRGVDFA